MKKTKNLLPAINFAMRTDIDFFNHYTQKNDPRIFPWGAFMRKSRTSSALECPKR
ncbi:hypothetical protein [Lebetimonas sp. JH292]|uniref:hypothetical protein n=1 Tax=Lebetimonas sp. JH292 TaxID=990068 RepID=UPI0004B4C980|nr:hypothetical protein [Lebetimonas sp. JH292]